jgi:hypothetical protein
VSWRFADLARSARAPGLAINFSLAPGYGIGEGRWLIGRGMCRFVAGGVFVGWDLVGGYMGSSGDGDMPREGEIPRA